EHFLSRQPRPTHIAAHPTPDVRQGPAKVTHAGHLRLVTNLSPARMVSVLLAAASITTDGLEVARGRRTDPYVTPRRRNSQGADRLEHQGVGHPRPVDVAISETPAGSYATDSRLAVTHIP